MESTAIYPHTILTRIDNSMREYGGWMSRHSGQPSLDVQLTIKTDFVDQFRNSSVGDLMVVTFNGDELARVNWKNMSTGGTLDFATIAYVHPDARQFLATYCEKYPLLAPRFCRRIASGRKYHS